MNLLKRSLLISQNMKHFCVNACVLLVRKNSFSGLTETQKRTKWSVFCVLNWDLPMTVPWRGRGPCRESTWAFQREWACLRYNFRALSDSSSGLVEKPESRRDDAILEVLWEKKTHKSWNVSPHTLSCVDKNVFSSSWIGWIDFWFLGKENRGALVACCVLGTRPPG